MKKGSLSTFVGVGAVLLTLLSGSLFVVEEGSRAIKLRFNKVVRDSDQQVVVYQPGLNFKIPFLERVVRMDARIQTLDDQADRFLTIEKKDVLIDSYVKWRITDFGTFYTTTGGQFERADNLLRRKINDRLRNEVGSQTISDIVSGTRTELMSQARIALNNEADGARTYGIEVVDVRVNKIELPEEVSTSIYQRMRAERMAVAGEHRAQGQEQAQKITAQADRNVQVILADAQLEAQKIRSAADAISASIYNQTYSKNPELFNLIKSFESYRESLANNNSVLLVKPGANGYYNDLFKNNLSKTTRQPNPQYNLNIEQEKEQLLTPTTPTPATEATPAEPSKETTPATPTEPASPATPSNARTQPAQPATPATSEPAKKSN